MTPHEAILGAMIIDPACIAEVANKLDAKMFPDHRHRLIWNAVLELDDDNSPVNLLTLRDKLGNDLDRAGGVNYLVNISELVLHGEANDYYCDAILEAYRKAEIRNYADDARRIASMELSSSEMTVELDKAFRKRTEVEEKEEEGVGKIAECVEFGKQTGGLVTGFDAIDDVIVRIHKTDYVVIAGRPGMGKTSLMTNIATNLACVNGVPVSFYSCEMSPQQIVKRMCSAISEVPLKRVESRYGMALPDDIPNLKKAARQLSSCPMYIKSAGGITPSRLKRSLLADVRRYGVKLAMVDHLHLMKPDKGTGNGYQDLTNISRSVKQVSLEVGIPLIMGCQLSRTEEAKEPKLMDIRGTGAIEEDADVVIGIHRPSYWLGDHGCEAHAITLKGRHFGTGRGELDFSGELTSFFNKK